jgi:hypothetical protein
MPQLPSGLKLAIHDGALFNPGGNWFHCPEGHFWYWMPDPQICQAPFSQGEEILQKAEHAPVPLTIEDMKQFIHVLEIGEDGKNIWRGEWLSTFPQFTSLSDEDREAWNAWLDTEDIQQYLQDALKKCANLAKASANATGYATLHSAPPDRE